MVDAVSRNCTLSQCNTERIKQKPFHSDGDTIPTLMKRDIKACAADATVLVGMKKYTARGSEAFLYIYNLTQCSEKTQGVTKKHSCKLTKPVSCELHCHVWNMENWECVLLGFDLAAICWFLRLFHDENMRNWTRP